MTRRGVFMAAGTAMLIAVVVLAAVVFAGGGTRGGKAGGSGTTRSSAPGLDSSALPAGAWQLPAGTRTEGVVRVGYPQTALGAVAMAYNTAVASTTFEPGVLAAVQQATALHPSSDIQAVAARETTSNRAAFGLPTTGPSNATASTAITGCKVLSAAPTKVVVLVEAQIVEVDPAHSERVVPVVAPSVVVWDGADWKIDGAASESVAKPTGTPPGPTGVSADEWHTCSIR